MPPEEAGQPNRRYRIARLVVLPADGVIGVFDERIDVVDGQVDGALDGRGEGGEIGAFEHEGVERLFLRERGGGAHDFGFEALHVEVVAFAFDDGFPEFGIAFHAPDVHRLLAVRTPMLAFSPCMRRTSGSWSRLDRKTGMCSSAAI